jgi:hypothetical protein
MHKNSFSCQLVCVFFVLLTLPNCTSKPVTTLTGTTRQVAVGYGGPSVWYPIVAIIPQGAEVTLNGQTRNFWVTSTVIGQTAWFQDFLFDVKGNINALPEIAEPYPSPNDETAYYVLATQQSRTIIDWSEAGKYLGWEMKVCGPVASANYGKATNESPTFINLGNDYPSPVRFDVLIWGNSRANFPSPPEEYYLDKSICVKGKVSYYQGVYQMEVSSPRNIEIQ